MTSMKCIIVDDEPLAREGIELNIQDMSSLELVGEFANAIAANDFLAQNDVDLMFLDVQMPGMTGLDFLRTLNKKPLVIMTTAYPEYALEGFELDVIDYLVKPIRLERFVKAVNKAQEIHSLYQVKDNNTVESISSEFIYIKSERKYIRIFFKDILYIKGLKDYVMLHTTKEKVMTAMNIKTINAQLPSSMFVRISKSYIINIHYVDFVDQDFIQVAGEEIPLGKTYKEDFINNYIKTNLIQRG
ncbi:MAG: LytTR family DNA-binding domain-containing protein [Bacteroidota bacterium]